MKPTILIENEVYRKVMHWVNKSQYEVSGLGLVKVEPDGILRVTSAILLPQKNGSTHTDIEPEDVNKALFQLRAADGELRWWWHSHVKMNVFWSNTDHDTIRKVGNGGWFACTVFNQLNEIKSCYYGAEGQRTPWGSQPLFIDELTTKLTPLDLDDTAAWDKEYDENVTTNMRPVVVAYEGKYRNSATGAASTTSGTRVTYNPREAPPEKRPAEMPKRMYKAWKQAYRAYIDEIRQETFDMRKEAGVDEMGIDAYGFTQDERTIFSEEGWTLDDLDTLVEDFTPSEMLALAKLGIAPKEVTYLLAQYNYSSEDIMAMAENSEVFGTNLFEGVQNYGGKLNG